MTNSPIVVIGAFDSKGAEYEFLLDAITREGGRTTTVNFGILGSTDRFKVDVEATEVARAGGADLTSLRVQADRGAAMKIMAAGVAVVARATLRRRKTRRHHRNGWFRRDERHYRRDAGLADRSSQSLRHHGRGRRCPRFRRNERCHLIPSVVDVAGLNRISRTIYTRAAGAIVGMVRATPPPPIGDRPVIAASMFGNTTQCVDACRELLEAAGYEVLTFHATGVGGRTMESLIDEGFIDACLDITTTEWADQLCGGVFSAGEDRLSAPGRRGIPI